MTGPRELIVPVDKDTCYVATTYGSILIDVSTLRIIGNHRLCLRQGYPTFRNGSEVVSLHRLVNKTPVGMDTDHINGNKLDCRKANLRTCTRQQNGFNRGANKNSKTGVVGVCWNTGKGKWQADIRHNRRRIYLGLFDLLADAIAARKAAEIKYFGKFSHK